MPLTNVTRRSIIDIAGVLDKPLKLVAIKSSKMTIVKCQQQRKTSKTIFGGEHFCGGQLFGEAIFREVIF